MQANFARCGGVVIVELTGRLDFEGREPFRKTCMERLLSERVVFDLRGLSFVGSLGLKDFVAILGAMHQSSLNGIRFSGVSPEFRRLFEASGLVPMEFYESPEKAIQSFTPLQPAQ